MINDRTERHNKTTEDDECNCTYRGTKVDSEDLYYMHQDGCIYGKSPSSEVEYNEEDLLLLYD